MKFVILFTLLCPFSILAQDFDTIQIGQTTYIGKIIDGQLNGFGYEYDKGKLIYKGQFLNFERHGQGKSFYGHIIDEGRWEHGQLVEGKLSSTLNEIVYEGIWKNGELVNGKIYYQNGFYLQVSTRKLSPHGPGTMFFDDGTKIETNWKNGRPIDEGIIYYPDGSILKGYWKRTKLNEIVLMVNLSGKETMARLTDGNYIWMTKQ